MIDEEVIVLEGRLHPEVPAPVDVNVDEDSDGWCQIDQVGAWESFLCEFQVLDEVPAQHRGTWVWAWGLVMQRIQAADSGKELDRALMWLCFLPQALLRQAKRGGKAGRKLVVQRFNSLVKGDCGILLTSWERDKMVAREKQHRQRERKEEEILE